MRIAQQKAKLENKELKDQLAQVKQLIEEFCAHLINSKLKSVLKED